jgi:predicted ABC-type sugar transport system permease subunit
MVFLPCVWLLLLFAFAAGALLPYTRLVRHPVSGEGSVLGAPLGALTMQMLQSGCPHMGWPNCVQEIVTGATIGVAAPLDRVRHGLGGGRAVSRRSSRK